MNDLHEQQQGTSSNAIEEPEPWESWETWLCSLSIALGIIGLIILGFIVNHYFL